MDYASYLRVLLSVWVGLGLGQLVQAVHKLARFSGEVRWDWVPVTWAGLAFLMFVQTWWAYYEIIQSTLWANLFGFLLPLAIFVILYLICASAMPDVSKVPEGKAVDLRAFYAGQHRYFFSLWGTLLVLATIVSVLVQGGLDIAGDDGFRMVAVGAAIALAWSPNRRLHAAVTLAALAALIAYIVLFTLRLS